MRCRPSGHASHARPASSHAAPQDRCACCRCSARSTLTRTHTRAFLTDQICFETTSLHCLVLVATYNRACTITMHIQNTKHQACIKLEFGCTTWCSTACTSCNRSISFGPLYTLIDFECSNQHLTNDGVSGTPVVHNALETTLSHLTHRRRGMLSWRTTH